MIGQELAVTERTKTGLGLKDYQPVLDRLLEMLRHRLGDRLLAVALFGSAARGQAGPHSDLDLMVIHRGQRQHIHNVFVELVLALRTTPEYSELEQKGILPDPYPLFISLQKLADTPWILLDLMDHGLALYDPEGILAAKLKSLRARLKELGTQKIVLEDGTWYWDLKPDWKPGELIEL
jgi:uncharacterized protein